MKKPMFKCLDCEEGCVPNSSSPTGASPCQTCNGTALVSEDPRSERQKARDEAKALVDKNS